MRNKYGYTVNYPHAIPLGIAILTSVLRTHDYKVEQDDLDAKVYFDNKKVNKESKKTNLAPFDDRKRITNYINTGYDPILEEEGEKILKKTNFKNFDVIGLSLCGQHNFSVNGLCFIISKILKEKTGANIVVGGLDTSDCIFRFEDFIKYKYIDFVIPGHGEDPLLNLCYSLENDCVEKTELSRVFYKNKKHSDNPDKYKFVPYIPFKPDFDGLPLNLYRYNPFDEFSELDSSLKSNLRILMLPYSYTFGCTNKCAFCAEYKCGFACKKISEVVSDLEELIKKYKTKYFFFLVNNINPFYKYAKEFAEEILKNDLEMNWAACAHFGRLDKKLLQKLKNAGAIRFIFGLESGSNRLLKFIRKGFTSQQAQKILRLSDKLGIWNEIELIAGLPHENERDIELTINFIKTNRKYINYCYTNEFILKDCLFLKFPEKFGIMNIQEKNDDEFPRRFDEKNGLKWEEKKKQIHRSMKKLNQTIETEIFQRKEFRYYHPSYNVQLLFYLHSMFKNKNELIEHLQK